ncbi:GAF domain-containing sensor histidine kinase [Mycobacterium servetii]|uniref:GAF domain-containing sensor histidine kinase n=1 Tax=Mycobacterium servetii TaxID=3237418 RepID=A0ABV4BVZ7_9MYCO
MLVPADPEQASVDVDALVVSAAVGRYSDQALGQCIPISGSTAGEVFRPGEPLITSSLYCPADAITNLGERSAIVMPLSAEQQTIVVIVLTRNGAAPPFDPACLHLVGDFAGHAAIAVMLATTRRFARELSLLTDRERIAADLHDLVIHRVFSVGMGLQSVAARLRSPELAARVSGFANELEDVINDIRVTVFDLPRPATPRRGFAECIQDAVARLTEGGDISTSLSMAGRLAAVSEELAEHAEAFLVEALGHAVRHSGTTRIAVTVGVDDISAEVSDDGPIRADDRRRCGLADLARRSGETGGRCVVTSSATGDTVVSWSAALNQRTR